MTEAFENAVRPYREKLAAGPDWDAQFRLLRAATKHPVDALREAEAAMALFPAQAYPWIVVALVRIEQGQTEEAMRAIGHALTREPHNTEARALFHVLNTPTAPPRKTVAWPKNTTDDPVSLIRRTLLRGAKPVPFITPATRFSTLGSCFALNVSRGLEQRGYASESELMAEEVNNTFANRYLLEWIENGPRCAATQMMEAAFGPEARDRLKERFASTNAFVFTLGLAPTYFREDTGEFFFINTTSKPAYRFTIDNCRMRTTSVEENVANIRAIVASLRRLGAPSARIVLTVSPVPLAATSEFSSVVEADAVSKSVLRAACHEALSNEPDVIYWPSFEIVRWLSVYFDEAHPGYLHSAPRHVAPWLIDTIVDLFIETYSV